MFRAAYVARVVAELRMAVSVAPFVVCAGDEGLKWLSECYHNVIFSQKET